MIRKLLIAMLMAIMLLVPMSGVVLAATPLVSVDVVSPGGGDLDITTTGVDSSTWNTGSVGQVNTFSADGQFVVSYDSYAGNYGSLSSYVNAQSTAGALFTMADTQDFNILSANHNYNTVGTFTAIANNPTGSTAMNLKSIGSMYCWSEATNPYSQPALQGTLISKQYDMNTASVLTSTMYIGAVAANGVGISNSNIWGWGANENGTITTNYSGGIRSLTASGVGSYTQYVSAGSNAVSNVSYNADGTPVVVTSSLPVGGTITIIANFLNSFSANPYTITAK